VNERDVDRRLVSGAGLGGVKRTTKIPSARISVRRVGEPVECLDEDAANENIEDSRPRLRADRAALAVRCPNVATKAEAVRVHKRLNIRPGAKLPKRV